MTEQNFTHHLSPQQWLICVIAALGFAFDIYELLMLPLIVRPALLELGGITPGTQDFAMWFGLLFYVPALFGGAFGLLGGWLTDRFGRRRIMTGSIMLYAVSSFAAGFSTSLPMLLFLRCLVFVGVCVEFVAAVAWLAELFPDRRQREGVLGTTQAFSSLGGLLVATANGIAAAWAINQPAPLLFGLHLPALQLPGIELPEFVSFLGNIKNHHADWRYTLMSGVIPAFPLILIRPFLPESPLWLKKHRDGTLKRPRIKELFTPGLRRTTIIVTMMFTLSFAAAFGAIQQVQQIVPGLPEVKAEIADALSAMRSSGDVPRREDAPRIASGQSDLSGAQERRVTASIEQINAARITKIQEIGGLFGRIALAVAVLFVLGRQRQIRLFLFPGLIIMPLVFGWAGTTNRAFLEYGMFMAGFLTMAQFSFWGNYLPLVFPLHLRGTGESFAANVGGRMIGTCFAALTQWIAWRLPLEASWSFRVALTAAGVAFACYLINYVLSFHLPEPGERNLAE